LIETINNRIFEITKEAAEEEERMSKDIEYADKGKKALAQVTSSSKSTYEAVENIRSLAEGISIMADHAYSLVDHISATTQQSAAGTEEASAHAQEQSAATEEILAISKKINSIADDIDIALKSYINNVTVGDRESHMIREGFDTLNSIVKEIREKSIPLNQTTQLLKSMKTSFEYLAVMDEKGLTVGENIPSPEDSWDCSHRPYFKQAINGNTYTSRPYISNASYNYCITLAVPIKDEAGKAIAVMMGDLCIES
jgi:methyl-accepting chemotaxis protein